MNRGNLAALAGGRAGRFVAAFLFFADAAVSARTDWFSGRLVLLTLPAVRPDRLMGTLAPELVLFLAALVWTVALLVAGIGLVRCWAWSWWLATALLVLTVLGAAFDFPHGRALLGAIYLFVSVAMLLYLTRRPVRVEFNA